MSKEHVSSYEPERSSDWTKRVLSRRTLTKALAGGALLATTQDSPNTELPPIIENHPEISEHMVMIDFAPDEYNTRFMQWMYYSDDEMLKSQLQGDYLGSFERSVVGGVYSAINWISENNEQANNFFDWSGFDGDMEMLFLRHNPQFAIAAASTREIAHHGEGVNHVMWHTAQEIQMDGLGVTSRIYPIQKTMQIAFSEDELGNYTLMARVNPDKVIDALSHYPTQDIVNFSWQVGDVHVTAKTRTYDAHGDPIELDVPEISKKGAYRKEAAVGNLQELFKICDAYPDKLFFAALGNLGDDIREAREILTDAWPENVLIVGEWVRDEPHDYGRPYQNCYGGDIYIENKAGDTQFAHGSSHSTAELSTIGAKLRSVGYTREEIKDLMLTEFSERRYYVPVPDGEELSSFVRPPLDEALEFNFLTCMTYLGPRSV